MQLAKILGLGVLGVAFGAGVGLGIDFLVPESPLVRGLFVGGKQVPRGVDLETWLDADRVAIDDRTIVLRLPSTDPDDPPVEKAYKFSELGMALDVNAVVRDAEKVGHLGKLLSRVREAREARRGEIDVPFEYRVREAYAETILERFADGVARAPIDARIDLARKRKIADIPGRELDVAATLAAIESSDFHDGEVIDVTTRPVNAKVTIEDLTAVNIEKVVSSYETQFHLWGTGAGRAVNIGNAVHFIDGLVVMPGEVFSFNDHVGPRTLERGFTWAPEIQADELTMGVGGGTCQASTTLFGAALFATLEIVERRSHSRPSSYTKMGLDATVIYGSQDLKIKNTLPFPIMIHAYLPTPESVRVELLGGDPVADVSYTFGIGSSAEFERRITEKPFLPHGAHILHQRGGLGYEVTSVVSIKWRDGRSEERSYFSGYRPTPEVFWVGPGYDEKDLPPLPEHARGIEGRTSAAETYTAL